MTFLLWIVRLIILLIIIRFVVSLVQRAFAPRPTRQPRASTRAQERLGGTLVQDPQCGTYLPQDRAVALVRAGATHYFCSAACRDEWTTRA